MKIISLYAAKHGVGVSTIAAVLYAQQPRTSMLIAADQDDIRCLLGMAPATEDELTGDNISHVEWKPSKARLLEFDPLLPPTLAELRTAAFSAEVDTIIMDWGTVAPCFGKHVMVTDNSYVALRRAVKYFDTADTVVLVRDHTRPLTADDVRHALSAPVTVTTVDRDSSLMRACDAGILSVRVPSHITRALGSLTQETAPC